MELQKRHMALLERRLIKMIYFTGDTHFCHNKSFLYEPRGFKSIEEHDKTIVKNWNSIIKPEDEVYLLGDVMLMDNEKGLNYLKNLNGKIHIILGNHCTDTRIDLYKTCPNVVSIDYAKQLRIGKNYFFLCHYPVITANYDDQLPWSKHLIHLYAHTHQKDKFYNNNPYMYCVCLDAHNNRPVELQEIIDDIKNIKIQLDNQ
jgi:calcineurin-like phosphoesterase family protein